MVGTWGGGPQTVPLPGSQATNQRATKVGRGHPATEATRGRYDDSKANFLIMRERESGGERERGGGGEREREREGGGGDGENIIIRTELRGLSYLKITL